MTESAGIGHKAYEHARRQLVLRAVQHASCELPVDFFTTFL